jgi:hypothetical protein
MADSIINNPQRKTETEEMDRPLEDIAGMVKIKRALE